MAEDAYELLIVGNGDDNGKPLSKWHILRGRFTGENTTFSYAGRQNFMEFMPPTEKKVNPTH
jgi:hypothetical protein